MLSADEVAAQLDGLVHLDTQRADTGIDLTVQAVHRATGPGHLDFGGSEFSPVADEKLTPTLDDPDDDYAWWTLDEGAYVVRFNESVRLESGQTAVLRPLERILRAGAHHAAFGLEEDRSPITALLLVSSAGCRLKENCRLTRIEIRSST
jgi:deoxycytidine triphosphate deaminase